MAHTKNILETAIWIREDLTFPQILKRWVYRDTACKIGGRNWKHHSTPVQPSVHSQAKVYRSPTSIAKVCKGEKGVSKVKTVMPLTERVILWNASVKKWTKFRKLKPSCNSNGDLFLWRKNSERLDVKETFYYSFIKQLCGSLIHSNTGVTELKRTFRRIFFRGLTCIELQANCMAYINSSNN